MGAALACTTSELAVSPCSQTPRRGDGPQGAYTGMGFGRLKPVWG